MSWPSQLIDMEVNKSIVPSSSNVRVVDVWYLYRNISEVYWGATLTTGGFGLARGLYGGNWATLRTAHSMASFGIRAHVNAARGVFNTPLSMRAGSRTLGGALRAGTASLVAAYTLGAVGGVAASELIFGEGDEALALYLPGGPSFIDDGLLGIPRNLEAVINHYLA